MVAFVTSQHSALRLHDGVVESIDEIQLLGYFTQVSCKRACRHGFQLERKASISFLSTRRRLPSIFSCCGGLLARCQIKKMSSHSSSNKKKQN